MFFLYRRLLFAIIINFIDKYAALQLPAFNLIGITLLAYIAYWQPLEKEVFNILASFNEFGLVFLGYQMYLFTDYVSEPEKRYFLGKCLLSIVYILITINLVVLGAEISWRFVWWMKG